MTARNRALPEPLRRVPPEVLAVAREVSYIARMIYRALPAHARLLRGLLEKLTEAERRRAEEGRGGSSE